MAGNYKIDLGEGAGLTEKDVTRLLGELTPDEIEQVGRCIDELNVLAHKHGTMLLFAMRLMMADVKIRIEKAEPTEGE